MTRQVQHRDRVVSAADFAAITLRAPGVEVGRVEILPAFHPDLVPSALGDAPGVVTLMLIPKFDADHPDAPTPDRPFLDAVCRHLDPRRLVTTELYLRPPVYKPVWVSVGIELRPGAAMATTREAVRQAVLRFLAPLPPPGAGPEARSSSYSQSGSVDPSLGGWPLGKAVMALELATVAARVPDVLLVRDVLLGTGTGPSVSSLPFSGLELPRVAGLSVAIGDPTGLDQLRGQVPSRDGPAGRLVPVPVVPEECR